MSIAAVRQRTSAQDAIKSTTAPLSASGRYKLVCELQIQLSRGGCVTLGGARRLCLLPRREELPILAELAVSYRQPEQKPCRGQLPQHPKPTLPGGPPSKAVVMGQVCGSGSGSNGSGRSQELHAPSQR